MLAGIVDSMRLTFTTDAEEGQGIEDGSATWWWFMQPNWRLVKGEDGGLPDSKFFEFKFELTSLSIRCGCQAGWGHLMVSCTWGNALQYHGYRDK